MKRVDIPSGNISAVLSEIRGITISAGMNKYKSNPQSLDKAASWAVYPTGDEDHTPTDQELCDSKLSTSVFLMGSNWGSDGAEDVLVNQDSWANYHTDPTENKTNFPHRRLRRAIGVPSNPKGIPELQGAYMSDVVKLVSSRYSQKIGAYLLNNPPELKRCASILREEFKLCRAHNGE